MLKSYNVNGVRRALSDETAIALGLDPKDGKERRQFTPPASNFMIGGKPPMATSAAAGTITSSASTRPHRKTEPTPQVNEADLENVTETPATPDEVPAPAPDEEPATTEPGTGAPEEEDDEIEEDETDDEDVNTTPNPDETPAPTPAPETTTKDETDAANKKRTTANGRTRKPRSNG